MFAVPFHSLREVLWENLLPGMVVLEGVSVNGSLPVELLRYPVLTESLIDGMRQKYHFLRGRRVTVGISSGPADYKRIEIVQRRINSLNLMRKDVKEQRLRFAANETSEEARTFLIKDRFNSFVLPVALPEQPPSLFDRSSHAITLQEMLTGRLREKLNLPEDVPAVLHLVVDYSYSMNTMRKLEYVIGAVNQFYKYLTESLLNTKIRLYVFSENCAEARFPLVGREIERKNTNYAAFMRTILRNRQSDVPNHVILFTDGVPSDAAEAQATGVKLKTNRVDYSQIVFRLNDDLRHEVAGTNTESLDGYALEHASGNEIVLDDRAFEEKKRRLYEIFTRVAECCGGNQIIVDVYEMAGLIFVESYDRYLGLLSLPNQ